VSDTRGGAALELRGSNARAATLADAFGRMRVTTAVVGLGAVGIIGGSGAPWLRRLSGPYPVCTARPNGWITLGCGVVAIMLLAARKGCRWRSIPTFLAFAAARTVGYDGARIVRATSELTLLACT
jgi:hypothetical protein